MSIKLSAKVKDNLKSYLTKHIYKNSFHSQKPRIMNKMFFIPVNNPGQENKYLNKHSPSFKPYRTIGDHQVYYRSIYKRAHLLQKKSFSKFLEKLSKDKDYVKKAQSYFTPWNVKSKNLSPVFNAKSPKIRRFNSIPLKRSKIATKLYNNFYQTNLKTKNKKNILSIEKTLEVILVRAHWAISINQARFWIRTGKITNKKTILNPGDTVYASESIKLQIIENRLNHLKRKSPIASYIYTKKNSLTLLRDPSLSEIFIPVTMAKRTLDY